MMENCALCYNALTTVDTDRFSPQIFETCCKYLHSAITKISLPCQLGHQRSLCTKCYQSAVELVDLNGQMEFYQRRISELVFILSLEILHRRGRIEDIIDSDSSRRKLIAFDVSSLPIPDFWNILGIGVSPGMQETQNIISENDYSVDFYDPLLMDSQLTENEIIDIKLENNPEDFIDDTHNIGLQFEDCERKDLETDTDADDSNNRHEETSLEDLDSSQQSSNSSMTFSLPLAGTSSDVPVTIGNGHHKRKKAVASVGRNSEKEDRNYSPSEEKRFQCLVCYKRFKRGEHLKVHTRSHTGERPYHCDVCKNSFQTKQGLLNHKRIHTGEQPFKCDFCDSRFTHQSAMFRHRKIHTGEKPHKCDQCDYATEASDRLKVHKIHVHCATNDFQCRECGKAFKSAKLVECHFKRIHFTLEFTTDSVIKKE